MVSRPLLFPFFSCTVSGPSPLWVSEGNIKQTKKYINLSKICTTWPIFCRWHILPSNEKSVYVLDIMPSSTRSKLAKQLFATNVLQTFLDIHYIFYFMASHITKYFTFKDNGPCYTMLLKIRWQSQPIRVIKYLGQTKEQHGTWTSVFRDFLSTIHFRLM